MIKKFTLAELKSLREANIPPGYDLLEPFDPTKRIIAKYILGLLLTLFALFVILFLNSFIRPDFNAYQYAASPLSLGLENVLLITLALIGLAIVTVVVHEVFHALVYYAFTRRKPQFGCRSGNPFAALALRAYLTKYEAALAAATPLVIISLILIPWKEVSNGLLPFIFATVIINVGLSTADIGNVFYFLSKQSDVLVGFDGYSGAVYKPKTQDIPEDNVVARS